MTILFPFLCWLLSTALRIAVVLCVLRMLQESWLTEPWHLFLVSLPFLSELMALLATPLPPFVRDRNDVRGHQLRRSYVATRTEERRNNMRANLFYLLLPGVITLLADIAALVALGGGLLRETEKTLLWAFGISVVAWLPVLLALKRFGPEYGPPSETTYHTRSELPPEPRDLSRREGMDADAPEDVW